MAESAEQLSFSSRRDEIQSEECSFFQSVIIILATVCLLPWIANFILNAALKIDDLITPFFVIIAWFTTLNFLNLLGQKVNILDYHVQLCIRVQSRALYDVCTVH